MTLLLGATILSREGLSQNLESIGKGEAFTLSGGLNLNQVFYASDGVEARRDPYNYFFSGNLNVGIYGWSMPLSFSYSNQKASFQQPFNQYGLSPTFKWITAHAGYRSMTFSKYTLAGHLFLGGGVELMPNQKWKIAAMYGRLQKAVREDTTNTFGIPTYQRMGGGVKVSYGSATDFVEMIVFKAADDLTSIPQPVVNEEVKPRENLVLGLGFGVSPIKGFSFKGEYASSALTTDATSGEAASGNVYGNIKFLYQPKVSSAFYNAFNGSANYQFSKYSFGLMYERVDPGYQTLGAYYFNSDLENISITHTSSWLNQKISVNSRFGLQRNNLDNTELSTMNRLSTSASVNYQVTDRLTTALNYSNFSTIVNFRTAFDTFNQVTPYDNLDTLNYKQVSQNGSSNINYVLNASKERRQNLSLNLSYQETSDLRAGEKENSGSQFYNVNSAYTYALANLGLTINVAGNLNMSRSPQSDNVILGPSTSVRKSFLKNKLGTTATLSYNNSSVNGTLTARVVNFRMGGNFTLKEVHQFTLNVTAVNRYSPQNETEPRYREFVTEFGYSYNFSVR